MPRKRRTANPDRALKVWIAPEWSARLHDSRAAAVLASGFSLSSGFSRYLKLADKVLSRGPKDNGARIDNPARRERLEPHNGNGHGPDEASEARWLSSEALMSAAVPRMMLPKPPKSPVFPKPGKIKVPKPRATPALSKPRKVRYPKPPTLPR